MVTHGDVGAQRLINAICVWRNVISSRLEELVEIYAAFQLRHARRKQIGLATGENFHSIIFICGVGKGDV